MKITVYTIKDCAFSKQEKEYLNANKLAFEEKDLETNKDFLTEMLAISNNFAGTPVTRVEKDDGTIVVLKGFTKEEFDNTFGFTATPASTDKPIQPTPTDSTVPPAPINDTPIPPIAETPPTVGVVPPVVAAVPPVSEPSNPSSTNQVTTSDPLKSVMDDLQSKSQVDAAPIAPPVETPVSEPIQPTPTDSTGSVPPITLPNVPEPDFK